MSQDPVWTYDASSNVLHGPEPKPDVPTVTVISANELGAADEHDVAEVDQDSDVLGTGYINSDWHQQGLYCEIPFTIPDWKQSGWYARFRRNNANEDFVLTHVWADEWSATQFRPWC